MTLTPPSDAPALAAAARARAAASLTASPCSQVFTALSGSRLNPTWPIEVGWEATTVA